VEGIEIHPGGPRLGGLLLARWAAGWKDTLGYSRLEIGAIIEAYEESRASPDPEGMLDEAVQKAQKSDEDNRRRLERLADRYIKAGRKYWREVGKTEADEVPSEVLGRGSASPADLRRHFQQTMMRAMAEWLVSAKRHARANRLYRILTRWGEADDFLSGLAWFADLTRRPGRKKMRLLR